MCRIVLTMPLNMDIDNTVFTRSTHNTPSDGAGRLERPILINADWCLLGIQILIVLQLLKLKTKLSAFESSRSNKHENGEPKKAG